MYRQPGILYYPPEERRAENNTEDGKSVKLKSVP